MADAPDAVYRLRASPGERLVLVLLWRFAAAGDASPVVWPSAGKLAELTGFEERAVRRILASLAKLGAIARCPRPPHAMAAGRAWRLDPDPPVTVTARSPTPCPTGPPSPDPSVTLPLTERSPRSTTEAPVEAPVEAPPGDGGFRLHAPAVPKPSRGKLAKGQCSDEQWAVVVQAWREARELGGMRATWGRWVDNATNRKLAARIWADGYTADDLLEVMRHIGRRLATGAHDPQWTSLEHVARHVGRYLNEAAGQGSTRPGRGINPLCEPLARPPPDPRAPPPPPPEYIPDPDDGWMHP